MRPHPLPMPMEEKVNILVVDDLPDKRLAFREVLEDLDENLVLVGSGAEALRELLEREFAVIVLDVNMPDIDGIETAQLIRKHGKTSHTPIIFVTAYADEMQTERGYELGAVDYILTPVVPAILRSKVRVFVDLYRAQRRAAKVARAEAARAAAESAQRRSDLIALASRELSSSLDLRSSMERLLEVLVPNVGGCAVLSVDTDNGTVGLYRQDREPARLLETLGVLPPAVRRAMAEVQNGGYSLEIRTDAPTSGQWPPWLRVAHVLPLKVGERTVGALTVGTVDHESAMIDDRGLLEIATRAAIAFDNAQLYSSLGREMARAKSAEEKLQEANRRKDEFLAMLSHELRNPLAPIVTSAQVLDKVAPGDTRIAWVREVIERQVTHLAGLVDDLLDVSRITQGKITLNREAVELGKILEHSLEIVRPLIDSKRHVLSVNVPDTPVWVFGDFSRLSQIFSNVLHNAAKYTSDGGSIELNVIVDRGSVSVRVRDNGIGIEPQFLPHVFEVFTQGYRGLDRSQGGLGVGLAVVRRLIELHQGEVDIMSDGPGLGTEVSIRLPCISEVVQPTGFPEEPRSARGGKRILIVDDNADAAESIAVLMQIEGHEVKTVTDAMQALACLDAFAPQVAIIDIGLPGMNGYELAAGIRANRSLPKPLLIALTGYGQAEDFDRSRDAGFDHHFVKPAEIQAIQAAIDEAPDDAEVEERRTLV
ncbi:MAG TPA: response regulator [Gammaproteobacteria bacterium]|nr:response regulator [Gammaproteobacteria bacterium]